MTDSLMLDVVILDWLTVTSYEQTFYDYWNKRLSELENVVAVDKRALQYAGTTYQLDAGTAFLGTAFQKGRYHYMLRLSGYAAEQFKGAVYSQRKMAYVNITRMDIQATTEITEQWSQWELLCRVKGRGRTTGWVESSINKKGFETVYIGSRSSARMTRVYVKRFAGRRFLRFETEYKGQRADVQFRMMAQGKAQASQYLLYEVQNTVADKPLETLFTSSFDGVKKRREIVKVTSSIERREQWLLTQVLPAFTQAINDHEASGDVLTEFGEAIQAAVARWDTD